MLAAVVWACTTFCAGSDEALTVGKSYDWHMGQALVMVNARGVAKRALLLDGGRPAEWVSRYGSITFNQYGREQPNGGMNEAGLVVEVSWLDETRYAALDGRPGIGELPWIQMQLDLFATAAEVAAAADDVRIGSRNARVHYLACDRTGDCTAVEVLDGKAVVTRGARALANHTHRESAAYLARHVGFGGERPIPSSRSSLDRFVRASALAKRPAADPVAAAFDVLDRVSQGDYSQWNIVYQPASARVSWRTRASRAVKSVSLSAFDLRCGAPPLVLDIDEPRGGDAATRFAADDGGKANRRLVEKSLTGMPLPPGAVELLAAYPATLRCATAR